MEGTVTKLLQRLSTEAQSQSQSQSKSTAVVNYLVEESSDWCKSNGLVMYSKFNAGQLTAAPYSLLPSCFPTHCFHQAVQLATDFNILVHNIAQDPQFLFAHLQGMTEDKFTMELLHILQVVLSEGIKQKISLGIHRSDYMLHAPNYPNDTSTTSMLLKQVELNTISAAFPILSGKVTKLHKFMTERLDPLNNLFLPSQIPENVSKVPAAIATAFKLYDNKNSVVMMVVHPNETNTFDQRQLEYALWEQYGIKVLRRSLADIAERGKIIPDTSELTMDGYTIAVAYFRAGYTPDDYPSRKEWDARLTLERSLVIKCPNILYHLAGTKKVQQVLAQPTILERYLQDRSIAQRVQACFMGLYSLTDGDEGVAQTINKAISNPDDFVMKPQREGGGNLIAKEKLTEALREYTPLQRSGYILMDRIVPPQVPSMLVREGKLIETTAVSELGIYSTFISNGNDTVLNEYAGYLLRTKVASMDDGGVAAGVAVLDSMYLV